MHKLILRIAVVILGAAVAAAVFMHLTHRAPQPLQPQPPAAAVPVPPKPVTPTETGRAGYKGTIAIVIDDVGYTTSTFPLYDQIREPMTLSVLPNLAYSALASEKMHSRFEIILHLPMEPKTATGLEANTILVGMTEPSIEAIMADDFRSLRYARGASNHMGSKATEDTATMRRIMAELKRRKFYFIDSVTGTRSVVTQAAREAGVPCARRDVFIDNKLDPQYIRERLNVLKRKAASAGSAIGIGHDRKVTLEVLKEELPRMAKEGYRLVFVSDLLN